MWLGLYTGLRGVGTEVAQNKKTVNFLVSVYVNYPTVSCVSVAVAVVLGSPPY